MSSTIEQRVVSMQFDNSNFERNVQTSMNTLSNLKKSLTFQDSAKGLENIGKSIANLPVGVLTAGVTTATERFSALEIFSIRALQRISDKILNTSEALAKEFTITPVKTGFSEYEEKMNSVQTIMMSTGESLESVMGYLEELNLYADKTIYSFKDMTSNIGKFTNAGVNLDLAVKAIQGVSNEAAVSGANAQNASHAMYNFAQALSAGYVKLIDWKSIENANMATVEFKNELIKTALEVGTVAESVDGMYEILTTGVGGRTSKELLSATHNFNDSLQYQWMTTEVLTKTLAKYADEETEIGKKAFAAATQVKTFSQLMDTLKEAAQSGWAISWETIVGNFDEAKAFLTELSNFFGGVIDSTSNTRNAILKGALGNQFSEIEKRITSAGVSMETFQEAAFKAAKDNGLLQQFKTLDELVAHYGSFKASLKDGWLTNNIFTQAIDNILHGFKKVDEAKESLEDLEEVAKRVIRGDFGNGQARKDILAESGYNFASVQNIVNEMLGDSTRIDEELYKSSVKAAKGQDELKAASDEQAKALKALKKEAEDATSATSFLLNTMSRGTGREMLLESIRNILGFENDKDGNLITGMKGLTQVVGAFKKAWDKTFFGTTNQDTINKIKIQAIYDAIKGFRDFTEKLRLSDSDLKKFIKTLQGVFSIFATFREFTTQVIKGVYEGVKEFLEGFNLSILDATSSIAKIIISFKKWLTNTKPVSKAVSSFVKILGSGVKHIINWVKAFDKFSGISKKVKNVSKSFDGFGDAFDRLKTKFSGVFNLFGIFKDIFTQALAAVIDLVAENIGEVNINTGDWLNTINGGIASFREWIEENNVVYEVIYKLGNLLVDSVSKVKEFIGAFVDLDKIKQFFIDLWEFMKQFFDNFDEYSSKFKDTFGEFIESFKDMDKITLSGILDKFKGLKDNLSGVFSDIEDDFNGTTDVFEGTADGLDNSFKSMELSVVSFKDTIIEAVKTLFDKASNFVEPGGLIAILAGAEFFNMAKSISMAITSFANPLVTIERLLTGVKDALFSYSNAIKAKALVDLALAIGILAMSIVLLSRAADQNNVDKAAGIIIGIIGALAGLMITLNYMIKSVTTLDQSMRAIAVGGLIIELAASILILAIALKTVASMTDTDLLRATEILAGLALGLGAFCVIMSTLGVSFAIGAGSLVGIAASILILLKAIDMVNNVDFTGVKEHFIELAAALMIFLKTLTYLSTIAGPNMKSFGVGMLAMSAALYIIVLVFKELEDIKPGVIAKGLIVTAGILLIFKSVVEASRYAGQYGKEAGIMLIGMSIAIALLVRSMESIANLSMGAIGKGLLVVGAISACFAVLIGVAGKAKSNAGAIIAMSLLIFAVVAMMGALSFYSDQDKLESVVNAMSKLLLSLGAMAFGIGNFGILDKKGILGMIAFGLLLAEVAAILYELQGLDPDKAVGVAEAMSLVLATLVGSLAILNKSDFGGFNIVKTIGALTLLTVVAGLIGLIIVGITSVFEGTNPLQILATAGAISLVLLTMAGVLAICAAVGTVSVAAISGVNALMYMTGLLGGLIVALGVLGDVFGDEKVNSLLENGVERLNTLFTGIGTALGNLVGSFITNAMDDLPDAATNLKKFADTIGEIDFSEEKAEGIKALIGLISFMATENLKAGAADGISSIPQMISGFISGIFSLHGESVPTETEYGKYETFFRNLEDIGKGITAFMGSIPEDLDVAKVKAVAKLLEQFVGVHDTITGNSLNYDTFETFGTHLESLGKGLNDFATQTNGITEDSVTDANNALTLLSSLYDVVPKSGSLIDKIFTGSSDLSGFGTSLTTIGEGLAGFIKAFDGVNVNGKTSGKELSGFIKAFVPALTDLASISDDVEESDGLWQKVFGSSDLGTFSEQLSTLGQNMRDLYAVIEGLSFTKFTAFSSTLAAVATHFKSICDGTDYYQMEPFAEALTTIGEVDLTNLTNDTEAFSKNSAEMVMALNSSFESNKDTLKNSVTSMMKAAVKVLDDNLPIFATRGAQFSANINTGMLKISFVNTVASIVNGINSRFRNYYADFVATGRYICLGLKIGMANAAVMKGGVYEKANEIGSTVIEKLNKGATVESPSKKAIETGKYIDEGLLIGLNALASKVYRTADNVGATTVGTLSNAVSSISSMIESDMDTSPTIRPVLDLNGLSADIASMDGMFNNSTAFGLSSSINGFMNGRQNRSTTDDVVSAIRKLGSDLYDNPTNTYNIGGVTYAEDSLVSNAVENLVRAIQVERRM